MNKAQYEYINKLASTLAQIDNIETQLGKKHEGTDETSNASIAEVERMLSQPFSNMQEFMSKQPMMPKVEGADEFEKAAMTMQQAIKDADGLNKRFFYPSAKGKKASYIRKSTDSQLKNAGLNF